MQDNGELSGDEVRVLIEGLDLLIAGRRNPVTGQAITDEQREAINQFALLRSRLQQVLGMHFTDNARGWLDQQLLMERRERGSRNEPRASTRPSAEAYEGGDERIDTDQRDAKQSLSMT